MDSRPTPEARKVIPFFSLLQFLYWGKNGLWLYCVIFFRELGFDSQQIGWMNSIGTFVALVLLPVVGILSDRFLSPRKFFLLVGAILVPTYLAVTVLGLTLGPVFLPFALVVLLVTAGGQVSSTMLDSWAGEAMEGMGLSYGTVRKYGSGGFVVVSFLGSLFVGPLLPTWACGLVIGGITLLMFLLAKSKSMAGSSQRTRQARAGTRELLGLVFRNYRFTTYLLLVVAFCIFQGIVNLDMTYLMDHAGTSQSNVGLVGAFRALVEIFTMNFLARRKKVPPYWILLGLSGLLVAIEHLLYPWVDSLTDMMLVSILTGVSGGFYFGYNANYILQIVDNRAAGTAMSMLGLIQALVSVIFNSLGGSIIASSGVIALTSLVGVITLALTALFFLSRLLEPVFCKK